MKMFLAIAAATAFLLAPLVANAQSEQKAAGPPPVEQTLVPEGYFAVKLAEALKVGTGESEASAETALTSKGIAPRNGWIGDYPVTPDVVIELQKAVGEAADSGKLAMNKDEALKALENVAAELGLPEVASGEGQYAQNQPAQSYGDYSNPSVINNYYYDEGPPVVTYYPPPPDYGYLYAWVPSPFWSASFFFPGFFVLHDFSRSVIIHKKVVVVSNHFFDRKIHKFGRIDPVKRSFRKDHRFARDFPHKRGFRSAESKNSASSIFKRSLERPRGSRIAGRPVSGNGSGLTSRRGERGTPQPGERRFGKGQAETRSRDLGRGSFNRSRNFTRSGEMNLRGPSSAGGRSFSAPSTGGRRIERGPAGGRGEVSSRQRSFGGERSFSAPSMRGGGSRADRGFGGGFRGGGGGRGFQSGGGGFGGRGFGGRGFSGGGCRGRC